VPWFDPPSEALSRLPAGRRLAPLNETLAPSTGVASSAVGLIPPAAIRSSMHGSGSMNGGRAREWWTTQGRAPERCQHPDLLDDSASDLGGGFT
jgi:hypothetical protein